MNDWNGNRRAVFVTNGDTSHSTRERETRDYYATDPRAVEELLKRETFNANILEPACGGGACFRGIKSARLPGKKRGYYTARIHGAK